MKKAFWMISVCLMFSACAQVMPFDDMHREAGQIETMGQSTKENPAICYNPLWHNQEETKCLADSACKRLGKKAVYKETRVFSCRLFTPSTAIYTCE